jgi:hypothetical protein
MPKQPLPLTRTGYKPLYDGIVELLDSARRAAGRVVNSIITTAYWEMGRRIVEEEQRGRRKAGYGEQLIDQLARDLTDRFGRGFSRTNVFQIRQFYLGYQQIIQTPSGQSVAAEKFQTLSGRSVAAEKVQTWSGQLPTFPLSWSHYVRLLSVQDLNARRFYEDQALRAGWSVRQLDRQIASQIYERSKAANVN